jgi:SAM-dependent methyltransferase
MLEIGCGDNPRIDLKYDEYHCIDSSPHALSITEMKLKAMGRKVYSPPNHPALDQYDAFISRARIGWDTIPYTENNYFDFILADQFLEHLPRCATRIDPWKKVYEINPLINCLNECWRVAKPGARLQFNVPKWNSVEQHQDPTHLSAIPPQMWVYFDPADVWQLKESYGIKASFTLDNVGDGGWYHVFSLTAIK